MERLCIERRRFLQRLQRPWAEISACYLRLASGRMMDMETISRCGHPPVVVTASPIDDDAPPPINPPAGDVIGLEPGSGYPNNSGLTPEQERRTKLAVCKGEANNNEKICEDNSIRNRRIEFDDCEYANSVEYTLIVIGGRIIQRIPGKIARGLLPSNEAYAQYVGRNCPIDRDDALRSDKNSCEHKERNDILVCEAVYGS